MTRPRSTRSIVGAFLFAEAVKEISDTDLRDLRSWGVDTVLTEGDVYDADVLGPC